MERGRILIVGQTKENTYEIRNLLDQESYELEIALSREVAKQILLQRRMNVLVLHTEAVGPEMEEFFEFLDDRGIEIPTVVLGDEAKKVGEMLSYRPELRCFEKPYPMEEMLGAIRDLCERRRDGAAVRTG
ncbi:MAG: hypothetical protein ACUVYA_11795 [Planctomycetota bacterium]